MERLVEWLEKALAKRPYASKVHKQVIREDGDWYYVPVYVDMKNAYDKATLLQEIEDEWEEQAVQPGRNLLLIPAAR